MPLLWWWAATMPGSQSACPMRHSTCVPMAKRSGLGPASCRGGLGGSGWRSTACKSWPERQSHTSTAGGGSPVRGSEQAATTLLATL
eukprot:1407371-Prymnesium_polylepis.2